MQTSTTLRHVSPSAIALALAITLTAVVLFVVGAQNFVQSSAPMRATNTAEQDLRLVMQELERERLDQLNADAFTQALRARNAAEQDLRMVMQELERERLDQSNTTLQSLGSPVDTSSITCNALRSSCDR